ncbi:MAG: hypothetical protein IT201_09865 [Thermoleophilia bacterium]|nr:hypothetical protein [Thermoleophilia bacterium]
MSRRRLALAALATLLAVGVVLVAVELWLGAPGFGQTKVADPCTAEVRFPGDGIDATVQRVVLSGLNGAACELGTTREELVLAFVPEAPGIDPIAWTRETIERAVRSGLLRAVDDAAARDSLGSVTALVLREVIERAPIDWLVRGGEEIAEIVG